MHHIGITVSDLVAAKAFFLDLGLEVLGDGEWEMEGELVDKVTALDNARSTCLMLAVPGGGGMLELSQFHNPPAEGTPEQLPVNTVGLRHLSFEVDDLDATLARLMKHGAQLFNEVQTYENVYRLCYLWGPDGIIIELAERLSSNG
jgi:catechol 2,3-dioxygenase-like lactoylglutathione lyase family enzyme